MWIKSKMWTTQSCPHQKVDKYSRKKKDFTPLDTILAMQFDQRL